MRPRKTTQISKALTKKGFEEQSSKIKGHHKYYYFIFDGKKTHIYTYLSHGMPEYHKQLMDDIKKQLKFSDAKLAEKFLDCPFSQADYEAMLKEKGEL